MSHQADSGGRWFPPEEFYTDDKCTRCGVCCGSTDGHPCEHLRRDDKGLYYCDIYERRLGLRKTVDGHHFLCVPLKTLIENTGGHAGCAYVQEIRRTREEMGQDASDLGRLTKP